MKRDEERHERGREEWGGERNTEATLGSEENTDTSTHTQTHNHLNYTRERRAVAIIAFRKTS